MAETGDSGCDDSRPRGAEDSRDESKCVCSSDGGAAPAGRSSLFEGRRKLLIGGVGLSTVAATLASQPALAWGGGGTGGPITALCSPVGSHVSHTKQCTGSHTDYFCNTGKSWHTYSNSTLSACGFSAKTGCNVGLTLKNCLTGAYQTSSYKPSGGYSGQNWLYGGGGGFNQYGSGGSYNGGWWTYKSSSNSGNLECWLACGWLNAKYNSSNFGYTADQFVHACNTVLTSKNPYCYTNVKTALCQTLSTLCYQHRSPQPNYTCGGFGSVWSF